MPTPPKASPPTRPRQGTKARASLQKSEDTNLLVQLLLDHRGRHKGTPSHSEAEGIAKRAVATSKLIDLDSIGTLKSRQGDPDGIARGLRDVANALASLDPSPETAHYSHYFESLARDAQRRADAFRRLSEDLKRARHVMLPAVVDIESTLRFLLTWHAVTEVDRTDAAAVDQVAERLLRFYWSDTPPNVLEVTSNAKNLLDFGHLAIHSGGEDVFQCVKRAASALHDRSNDDLMSGVLAAVAQAIEELRAGRPTAEQRRLEYDDEHELTLVEYWASALCLALEIEHDVSGLAEPDGTPKPIVKNLLERTLIPKNATANGQRRVDANFVAAALAVETGAFGFTKPSDPNDLPDDIDAAASRFRLAKSRTKRS